MEAAAGDAVESWVVGGSSSVVAAPTGVATEGSGESCGGGWEAGEAAGLVGAHAPGREVALLDVKGGVAGTAVAADEDEPFEMIAVNCKKIGRTKTTCQNIFLSGQNPNSLQM